MAIHFDRARSDFRELSPEELGGKTGRYSWFQTNWEIRCHVPVDLETTKHDIRCVVRRRSLELLVFEEVILRGSLYDCVDVEECCWTLERCSEVFPPRLEVQLQLKKERESQGRNHWRCVVEGEPKIDVDWLGPPIKVVDPRDKDTLHLIRQSNEDPAMPFCNMRDPMAKAR